MTDYVKHEWPELKQLVIEKIFSFDNTGEEARYRAFIARMKSEGLIFELEKINRNELDRKIYHTDGLNTAELRADAGRSTRHSEHCMAQFNAPAGISTPHHQCTCSAQEYK